MLIENSYLTHSNGKILTLAGFGTMALDALANFGICLFGWQYVGFFQFILTCTFWLSVAGIVAAAAGAFLMYNEGRKINDIILCGTLLAQFVLLWIPSPHFIVTLILNVVFYSYLAAFALDAFQNDNKNFAIIFAGLLAYMAIIGPCLNMFSAFLVYEVDDNFFFSIIMWGFNNLYRVIAIAAPALCLLETNKKKLEGEKNAADEE